MPMRFSVGLRYGTCSPFPPSVSSFYSLAPRATREAIAAITAQVLLLCRASADRSASARSEDGIWQTPEEKSRTGFTRRGRKDGKHKKKSQNEPNFPHWRYRKRGSFRKTDPKRTHLKPKTNPSRQEANPNEPTWKGGPAGWSVWSRTVDHQHPLQRFARTLEHVRVRPALRQPQLAQKR